MNELANGTLHNIKKYSKPYNSGTFVILGIKEENSVSNISIKGVGNVICKT